MAEVSMRLFRSSGMQAFELPSGFEMPGREVLISKIGDRLVIEPVDPAAGIVPIEDLPEIEDDAIEGCRGSR